MRKSDVLRIFNPNLQQIFDGEKNKNFTSYFYFFSFDLQRSVAEVHADGGLHSAGELSGAQPVRQARLPHTGVPDHQNLEGPAAGQQGGHAAQRAGELQRGLHESGIPRRSSTKRGFARFKTKLLLFIRRALCAQKFSSVGGEEGREGRGRLVSTCVSFDSVMMMSGAAGWKSSPPPTGQPD